MVIENHSMDRILNEVRSFARLRQGRVPFISSRPLQIQKLLRLGIMFPDAKKTRYLDVGTGWGELPCVMSRFGWSAYGIDDFLDGRGLPERGHSIWSKYDCEIHEVSMTKRHELNNFLKSFRHQYFHIISLIDVLEHLQHSPRRVLETLWRSLAAGGFLYIEIPNHAMLKNRIRLLLGRSVNPAYLAYWNQIPFRGHFREYTVQDCREMCRFLPGSRIIELKTYHKLINASKYTAMLKMIYKAACTMVPNSRDSIVLSIQKSSRTLPNTTQPTA